MEQPIVLIISYGATKSEKVAEGIISVKEFTSTTEKTFDKLNLATHICGLKTKYYENEICLLPFEGEIGEVPVEVRALTEALIVFFDADDKDFLKKLPQICNFINSHNVELPIFLTNKLFDDSKLGLTLKDVKTAEQGTFFDVIELNADDDDDDYDDDVAAVEVDAEKAQDQKLKNSYAEVMTALRNNVWTNINSAVVNQQTTNSNEECSDQNMERQIEEFENLLAKVQAFKMASANLDRQTVLDEAEKLAELFVSIMEDSD